MFCGPGVFVVGGRICVVPAVSRGVLTGTSKGSGIRTKSVIVTGVSMTVARSLAKPLSMRSFRGVKTGSI